MTTQKSESTAPGVELHKHMEEWYGENWRERVLLGSYHVTYQVLSNQGATNDVPIQVMEGLDVLCNVVLGLYPED